VRERESAERCTYIVGQSQSRPGEARTILLLHIISVRPSKQPLMVTTFLKVYMELGSYFLFLQEQIKDIIIIIEENPLMKELTPSLRMHGNYHQNADNGRHAPRE
jgi:uncharacterized membrane protein